MNTKVDSSREVWKTTRELHRLLGPKGAVRHMRLMKAKGKAKVDAAKNWRFAYQQNYSVDEVGREDSKVIKSQARLDARPALGASASSGSSRTPEPRIVLVKGTKAIDQGEPLKKKHQAKHARARSASPSSSSSSSSRPRAAGAAPAIKDKAPEENLVHTPSISRIKQLASVMSLKELEIAQALLAQAARQK